MWANAINIIWNQFLQVKTSKRLDSEVSSVLASQSWWAWDRAHAKPQYKNDTLKKSSAEPWKGIGSRWLSGSALDLRTDGHGFESMSRPRASLSHPAPNGYLTLVRRLGNAWNPQSRGLWTLHHLPTDHLSWSVDATIFCIERASVLIR